MKRESERISTCYSGGAEGADLAFDRKAREAGHDVVHFGYPGMKAKVPLVRLTEEQILAASEPMARASKFMRRKPPHRQHVKNLTHRGYYVAQAVDSIYAVTRWNLVGKDSLETVEGQLGGGTGWAIAMGIQLGVSEVYLFAIEREQWYSYCTEAAAWLKVDACSVPSPSGNYAGIGSRELGSVGQAAIDALYVGQ